MQLRIVHTTGFEYAGKATASFNEARLTPQTTPGQIVVHTRLEVHPTPWTYTYRDYWGTHVTAFEVLDPHESLTVSATATVHTDRGEPAPPQLSWDDVREPATADRFTEHLGLPSRVAPPEELVDAVLDIAEQSDRPGTAARE
ncbi:MAG TPA: transglutaminase N-terminal domain-containing protein, partial [Marmoricola sp.]|nr:transglutaminase N-terminal domain-containing protein [Marmoricola sp.]